MTFGNSTIRALVPYQAPCKPRHELLAKAFRRCLSEMDKLFSARKKLYYSVLAVSFFGFFFGSYLDISLFDALSHQTLFVALRLYALVVFFFGVSLWGIALVPLCVFLSSCTIGTFIQSCSTLTFDRTFISSAILFFCLFLLASESLCLWLRCRRGWQTVIQSRGFLFNIFLLVICFIFSI